MWAWVKRVFCLSLLAMIVGTHDGKTQSTAVTFNPNLTCTPQVTLSNGNLTAQESGLIDAYWAPINASIGPGAKVYFEVLTSNYNPGSGFGGNTVNIGAWDANFTGTCGHNHYPGSDLDSVGYFAPGGLFINGDVVGVPVATWAPFTADSNVGIAIDVANSKIWGRVNGGNWNNSPTANPATNTGGVDISSLTAHVNSIFNGLTPVVTFLFTGGGKATGQFASSSWTYSAPSGFAQLSVPPGLTTSQVRFLTGHNAVKGNTAVGGIGVSGIGLDVSLFGATCNGVDDDAPAFNAAGNVIRNLNLTLSDSVTLNVAPNKQCTFKSCPFNNAGARIPFAGIPNFTLNVGDGTTMTDPAGAGCQSWGTGAVTLPLPGDLFATNNIGDSCVTMTVPGAETGYPVGRWVIVAGQGMQTSSFPPNYASFEYAQVASKPAGQVCFTAPLKNKYFSSEIPWGSSACSGMNCGSQAALLLMNSSWGGYFNVNGGTWNWKNEISWNARTVTNNNVTFTSTGQNCFFPTFIRNVVLNNNNYLNCSVEIDKEIESVTMNGGTISNLIWQSQSAQAVILTNGASTGLGGSPPSMTCNNSTVTMFFGSSFGTSPQTFTGNNCTIPSDPACCAGFNGFDALTIPAAAWTYIGGGQFTCDVTVCGLPSWANRGGFLAMEGNSGKNGDNKLTVGDLTIVATLLTAHTNLASGATLPPPNSTANTGMGWREDPVQDWSCASCTGGAFALEQSMAPAQHQPLWTYSNRTYTCANNIPNIAGSVDITANQSHLQVGAWWTVDVNVSTADSNPADPAPQAFLNPSIIFNTSTGVKSFLGNQTINLLLTGTRTITATGVNGAQALDILTFPGAGTVITESASLGAEAVGGGGNHVTNGPAAQCPVVNVVWKTPR